ncbi:MAG: hypothetical protein GF364_07715 [Candidatus Lokiarchaeota archaeon]|nr:hypothetical protein [Candidatus Lokiarchaeota archaeon]
MLLKKLIDKIEQLAPKKNVIESEFSGIQLGPVKDYDKKTIKKGILITEMPSIDAIDCARKNNYNLIISRLPLLNSPVRTIDPILNSKIFMLNQNHITLYVLNAAWDGVKDGVNDSLAQRLGLRVNDVFFAFKTDKNLINPAGKICNGTNLNKDFNKTISEIKRKLNIDSVRYANNAIPRKSFVKVLVMAGAYINEEILENAYKLDCNCIITGGFPSQLYVKAQEYKISIIEIGYIESFKPGLEKLKLILSMEFPHIEVTLFGHSSCYQVQ